MKEFLKNVKEYIKYEPATGRFFRIKSDCPRNQRSVGQETGLSNGPRGYLLLKYKGKMIRTHRLAWLMVHGEWPDTIDHINGNIKDNRIENLRNVSNRENCRNHYKHRAGKLVGANKNHGKWQPNIRVKGKLLYLGNFDTEKEAHEEYVKYLKKHLNL